MRCDPHVTQNMLRSFKTTTCSYLTNKAKEADSVSSQLTAPPPPPSAPSPPVSLCKHDRTPTRYLKLETDGIGERYECSTTRQVGKLESLMEQIGFCEKLPG